MFTAIFSSKLVKNLTSITSTILLGRVMFFVVVITAMFAVSVFNGYRARIQVQQNFNLDEMHYIVYGRYCQFIFNGETLEVLHQTGKPYLTRMYSCPPTNAAFLSYIAQHHESKNRAIYKPDVYATYIVGFVLFGLLSLVTLGNSHLPNIASRMTGVSIVFAWIIISLLLFPMTYRDYGMTGVYEYNGRKYSVISAVVSKDKSQFMTVSENFLSMNRDLLSEVPKKMDDI